MSIPLFRLIRVIPPFALAAVLAGCSSTATLQSSLPPEEIAIDGVERDWYAALRPVKNQNMSMGVVNDGEFLYVSLLTSDPALIHLITNRGLVLWIDPAGGRERAIGLQFPLGLSESAASAARTPEAREELFEASLLEMELVRDEGDERVRIPANSIPGIETGASLRNGTLFYESRIPLRLGGPYTFAAETAPGATIGVGIESAAVDPEVARRQMLEGAANSPMQGGGTYDDYYGTASVPRLRADDTVRVWRKVVLAGEG